MTGLLTFSMINVALVLLMNRNIVDCQSTPVPILKQINRQNGDGSYSYGYENADGSYKIETKYPNGEVLGKYGYVDDTGNLREIEYGASRRGFEPAGTGITVPPPVVRDENNLESDDGQYREDPSVYWKTEETPITNKLLSISSSQTNKQHSIPRLQSTQNIYPAPPAYQSYPNWNGVSNRAVVNSPTNFDPYSGSSYTITYNG